LHYMDSCKMFRAKHLIVIFNNSFAKKKIAFTIFFIK
jgi:hypothetical protein